MDSTVTPIVCTRTAPAASARCTASDVLRWVGLHELADRDTDAITFSTRRVRAENALLSEGQPFEHLYCIGAGSFKRVQTDFEGYEQLPGFAIHGDTLGLDGILRHRHASGAVALEQSSVAVMPFARLVEAGRRLPALERCFSRSGRIRRRRVRVPRAHRGGPV